MAEQFNDSSCRAYSCQQPSLGSSGDGGIIKTSFIVVCHGETVNDVFPQWLRLAYRGERIYQPYDLNMPAILPQRPIEHYRFDPPLTEHGNFVAECVGKGMKLAGYDPYVIYSSPELRCVQTAAAIARALEIPSASIYVEPALAEWVQFSPRGTHKTWLSTKQLTKLGYPVHEGYNPFIKELPDVESPDDYLRRLCKFFLDITESSERVLIIVSNAHALEVAMNRPWSTAKQLCDIRRSIRNADVREIDITKEMRVITGHPKVLPFTRNMLESHRTSVR